MYTRSLLTLLTGFAAAQSNNPFSFLSASTLFIGGPSPIVDTGWARFQGKNDDRTYSSNYLGIRYATARRFDHARLFNSPLPGIQDVSQYGPICPQHMVVPSVLAPDIGPLGEAISTLESLPLTQQVLRQSEDCLLINIQRPQDETLDNLPVLLWM